VRITVFDFILMLITSPGRDQVVHGFLFTDDLHLLVYFVLFPDFITH